MDINSLTIVILASFIYILFILYFKSNFNKITINSANIYEVHITIDPLSNYVKLLSFINEYRKYKLKPVFAVSSIKNNQYMLSYFTSYKNDIDVINNAEQLSIELEKYNIKVLRVKVESHNISKFANIKKSELKFYNYFEFHIKVSKSDSYEKLENDVKKYREVAISYNLCSKNLKPLLTIRIYNEEFENALIYRDKIIKELKDKYYEFENKIQQEFSIYDTNIELDKGWLN